MYEILTIRKDPEWVNLSMGNLEQKQGWRALLERLGAGLEGNVTCFRS